jgi:hypothetical protein
MLRLRQLLLCVALTGTTPAIAQDERDSRVVGEVTACLSLSDPQARLACFDTKVKALAAATNTRTIVVLDREEVRKTRRSLFGFALPRLPFFGNDNNGEESRDDTEAVQQIDTKIAGAGAYGHGLWTLILAEGGTWRTTETSRTFDPSPGDALTIKRGTLGNYVALVGGNRTVRVERVR